MYAELHGARYALLKPQTNVTETKCWSNGKIKNLYYYKEYAKSKSELSDK